MRSVLRGIVAVVVLGLPEVGATTGPADRYELGRRLRAMERAWEAADAPARARAAPALERAVGSFFGLDFGASGRALADAERALAGSTPDADQLRAESLALTPDRRLHDRAAARLELAVAPFYDVPPAEVPLRLRIEAGSESRTFEPTIPGTIAWTLADPGSDRDLTLRYRWLGPDDRPLAVGEQAIALVADRDARLAALRGPLGDAPDQADSLDRASARSLLGLLEGLAAGAAAETDLPGAALLAEAEALVVATPERPGHGPNRPGNHWLAVPVSPSRRVFARILVPEARPGPWPLVVALHGAGGSENLFFDGYGAGKIVPLCQQRGWLLVAPRSGPLGAAPVGDLIDALARVYPIDRARIALIGHSMGAAQAVAEAGRNPGRYSALAALGGSGRVQESAAFRDLAIFVAAGERDFALRGARGLRDALIRGEIRPNYREYPDVEHLAIVQAALGDVFDLLDRTWSR